MNCLAVTVGFQQTSYVVSEGTPSVRVCTELSGQIERSVLVLVSATSSATAQGDMNTQLLLHLLLLVNETMFIHVLFLQSKKTLNPHLISLCFNLGVELVHYARISPLKMIAYWKGVRLLPLY